MDLNALEPYQLRVLNDKARLNRKIKKLVKFTGGDVFGKLPEEDKVLLLAQVRVMLNYLSILESRVSRF